MFRRVSLVAALGASIMLSAPSRAELLQPLAGWVVNYKDDQCLASREYGTPEKRVTLGIRPAPNGETYEFLVARPRSGPAFAVESKGTVNFGQGPIKAWLLSYGARSSKSTVYQYRISADEMAQANSSARVTFTSEGAPDFNFELRSVPAVLKSLRECTADLQDYWNANGEKVGSIATPAKGDVRSVFTPDDYPGDAIAYNQEGSSRFLLLVDEKGAVAGCHVLKPSGVPLLDAMGCQVIRQRAKFAPALDRQGKPIRSAITTPPVSWRLY